MEEGSGFQVEKMTCLVEFGNCVCGKRYIVFHPLKRALAEKYSKLLGEETDFFVTEGQEVKCSFCGGTILLPTPETLDPERDPNSEAMDVMLGDLELEEGKVEKVLKNWLDKVDNEHQDDDIKP